MEKSEKQYSIMVISDGTGETATTITKAALLQFGKEKSHLKLFTNVRTRTQIQAIFENQENRSDLAVCTIVSPELRILFEETAEQYEIPTIDLLGPTLDAMAAYFDEQPIKEPGLLRKVNKQYFKRIASMEYTINHDDGKSLKNLRKADLILIGISRTSKTPLSIFLSQRGWRVCNIPIIKDLPLPSELFQQDQSKIIGLTIQVDVLQKIRKARMGKLTHLTPKDRYANLESVNEEIEYANDIFRKNRTWPIIDVSGKALEETAGEVIKIMNDRKG